MPARLPPAPRPETARGPGRRCRAAQQPLECHDPPARNLARPRDDPHAAPPQLFEELVIAETPRGRLGRSRVRSWLARRRLGRRRPVDRLGDASVSIACLHIGRLALGHLLGDPDGRPQRAEISRKRGVPASDLLDVRLAALPELDGQLVEERARVDSSVAAPVA